ncbi:MAG: diadenylate cyclase CdaA [Clostridia bacterium]|nr:diadenylate cyclase CdaA [Clostridia bacterium]
MEAVGRFFDQVLHGLNLDFLKEMGVGEYLIAVLDIAALTFLLYLIISLIADRRAIKLIIGIGLLFLIYVASFFVKMSASYMVLKVLFQAGVLTLFILFQPEIRDLLERVGTWGINTLSLRFINQNQTEVDDFINVTVAAVAELSRGQVGALIVIERSTKLGDIAATGTQIDGKPSEQLLRNLFYKGSPLHDGAVIIRDYRVAAAGCMLPSSKNGTGFGDMGARHRAGVGVSEVSDAVVIIVSEETGTISIANNGSIKRGYSPSLLKQDLSAMLKGELLEEKVMPASTMTDAGNQNGSGS